RPGTSAPRPFASGTRSWSGTTRTPIGRFWGPETRRCLRSPAEIASNLLANPYIPNEAPRPPFPKYNGAVSHRVGPAGKGFPRVTFLVAHPSTSAGPGRAGRAGAGRVGAVPRRRPAAPLGGNRGRLRRVRLCQRDRQRHT